MALPQMTPVPEVMNDAQIAPALTGDFPNAAHLCAFVEVARHASFSKAAKALGYGQPAVSKRVKALECSLGVSLLDRGERHITVTSAGHSVLRAMNAHFLPLCHALETLKDAQPVLTVALPTGAVRARVAPLIGRFEAKEPVRLCYVPRWAEASLSLRGDPRSGDGEDVFLAADEWAAVAGKGWAGGDQLTSAELIRLPLVAATPEEHDAWHMLLAGERPLRLMRASRADAAKLISQGAALGIANLPFLSKATTLAPVSKRRVWPGTGLWASLSNATPAWDTGWALVERLKAEFAVAEA